MAGAVVAGGAGRSGVGSPRRAAGRHDQPTSGTGACRAAAMASSIVGVHREVAGAVRREEVTDLTEVVGEHQPLPASR